MFKKKQLETYKIKSKIFKNVLQICVRTVDDATTKENNIDNVVKNNIIDLLSRRKNKNLFKKFKFDFYYAYKHLFTIFFVNLNAENNWIITIREKYQEIDVVKKFDKIDTYKKEVFFKIKEINKFIKQNQASSVEIKLFKSMLKQKSLLINKSLSTSDEKLYAFTQNLNRHENILYTFDVY